MKRSSLLTAALLVVCLVATAAPGLRASLFGLHMVDKANPTIRETADALERACFTEIRIERIPRSVVMNAVFCARCSG